MRVVFLGPPGAGKGTQSKLLCERLGFIQISTGELLREASRKGTEVGKEAASYFDQGLLVPDEVVWEIARPALDQLNLDQFILDGYPRTVRQAEWLDNYLNTYGSPLTAVVSFEIDPDLVIDRLSKRRVNIKTGENYHLDYKQPPPDVSPADIVQRDDDRPEAIRRRMEIYRAETEPVKDYYAGVSILKQVDSQGAVEDVYRRILNILQQTSIA